MLQQQSDMCKIHEGQQKPLSLTLPTDLHREQKKTHLAYSFFLLLDLGFNHVPQARVHLKLRLRQLSHSIGVNQLCLMWATLLPVVCVVCPFSGITATGSSKHYLLTERWDVSDSMHILQHVSKPARMRGSCCDDIRNMKLW